MRWVDVGRLLIRHLCQCQITSIQCIECQLPQAKALRLVIPGFVYSRSFRSLRQAKPATDDNRLIDISHVESSQNMLQCLYRERYNACFDFVKTFRK